MKVDISLKNFRRTSSALLGSEASRNALSMSRIQRSQHSLIDGKRRMPRPEAGMASLFNVSLGPPEPTDQEISEALLGPWKITSRVADYSFTTASFTSP